MLLSMTGYGRYTESSDICDIKVELKCLNSKYADVNIRSPKSISDLDIPLRIKLQKELLRGKIDLNIDIYFHTPVHEPVLNKSNFNSILTILEEIKTKTGIPDPITLKDILTFPDLLDIKINEIPKDIYNQVQNAVGECVKSVQEMRRIEGENLYNALRGYLDKIKKLTDEVKKSKDDVLNYWIDRFKSKVESLGSFSEDRVLQEASIYAEKVDITEEIERIYSHLEQFSRIMDSQSPVGKKLDFLSQEMYREWNTIASKSVHLGSINAVVEAKSLVDNIREQIQNIV